MWEIPENALQSHNKQENIILEAQNDKGENIKPTNMAKILGITFNKSLIREIIWRQGRKRW